MPIGSGLESRGGVEQRGFIPQLPRQHQPGRQVIDEAGW
jgi:hypothetical protein